MLSLLTLALQCSPAIYLYVRLSIRTKRRVTDRSEYSEHMAGTGNDHLSALSLKAEWESYLGLPYSAPYENVFDAGSAENQAAVRELENATESQVWVDTVSCLGRVRSTCAKPP